MACYAVIPARKASSRFPGKPLAQLLGKPMVAQVVARCFESQVFDAVWVASDDADILAAASQAGAQAAMTSPDCPSGTDRVYEVVRQQGFLPNDVVFNVQGDEPALPPAALRALARCFDQASTQMATLVRPLQPSERENPHVVKVVRTAQGRALYFSRASIPHRRPGADIVEWAHVGIYAFRAKTLSQLATLPPSPLELAESLEQLRALEAGIPIETAVIEQPSHAVDVPSDVPLAEAALRRLFSKE